MSTTVEHDLVRVAEELGAVLRAEGEEADRQRRITPRARDALAEAGFFRLSTPRSLGGLETDPLTCAAVIEEVARHDSTAGWTLMTGNAVDWWCARLPDRGPEEIYAEPNPVIAAAFHPPMQAVETDGGYRITGRAPLASTIHDATWFHCTALVTDGSQPRMVDRAPVVIGSIMRAREIDIIDTWYSLGMRGTDSNDVTLTDTFVPASRTFPLVSDFEPGSHYGAPLYRMPAMGFVAFIGPPVFLGIARDALSEFYQLAQRKTPFGAVTPLRGRTSVQSGVGKAEALLRSARAFLHDTLTKAWAPSIDRRARHPTAESGLAARRHPCRGERRERSRTRASSRRNQWYLRPQSPRASLPRRGNPSPPRLHVRDTLRDVRPGPPRHRPGVSARCALAVVDGPCSAAS